MNDTQHYLECSCHSEGLLIVESPDDKLVYLSMFYIGNPGKMGWKQKLRYCWEVLTKGKPFTDQLVFDSVAMLKLKSILNTVKI